MHCWDLTLSRWRPTFWDIGSNSQKSRSIKYQPNQTIITSVIFMVERKVRQFWNAQTFADSKLSYFSFYHKYGSYDFFKTKRRFTGYSCKIGNGYFFLPENPKSMLPPVWLYQFVFFMMLTSYVIDNNLNFYSKFHNSHFLYSHWGLVTTAKI